MEELHEPLTQQSPTKGEEPSAAERVRRVRARLPGQVLCERIETARAAYGPLYPLSVIQERVGESLPLRIGHRRTAILEPIESYRSRIPDEALLKFDEAERSGLFDRFWVATPAYREDRQVDPWLVGQVNGTELYAVIARWE